MSMDEGHGCYKSVVKNVATPNTLSGLKYHDQF